MRTIRKYIEFLEIILATGIFSLLTIFSTLKVLFRNLIPTESGVDISEKITLFIPHGLLFMGILGASIGLGRNQVITIDIISKFLSVKINKIISYLLLIPSALFLFIYLIIIFKSSSYGDTNWILFGYLPLFTLLFIKSLTLFEHEKK